MSKHQAGPYPNRLGEIMRVRGMNDPQLAELGNTTKQQINKLRHGERQLTARWAMRLAPHLRVDWKELMDLPNQSHGRPVSVPAARLAALRRAWWAEDEVAAIQLGVPLQKLQDQESGREPLDTEYVLKVLSVTGTSPTWVYEGRLADVSPLVAARLAVVAPELIEGLDAGLGEASKKGDAAA